MRAAIYARAYATIRSLVFVPHRWLRFRCAYPDTCDGTDARPWLKELSVLVGHWTYEEEWKTGPLGPGGKMTGVYGAHMILGGVFLQAEQTEKGAMGEIRNLEIDAYDQ